MTMAKKKKYDKVELLRKHLEKRGVSGIKITPMTFILWPPGKLGAKYSIEAHYKGQGICTYAITKLEGMYSILWMVQEIDKETT